MRLRLQSTDLVLPPNFILDCDSPFPLNLVLNLLYSFLLILAALEQYLDYILKLLSKYNNTKKLIRGLRYTWNRHLQWHFMTLWVSPKCHTWDTLDSIYGWVLITRVVFHRRSLNKVCSCLSGQANKGRFGSIGSKLESTLTRFTFKDIVHCTNREEPATNMLFSTQTHKRQD